MKRFVAITAASVLAVGSLTACGPSDSPGDYLTFEACTNAGYEWDVDDNQCEEVESKKKKKKRTTKTKTKTKSSRNR